MTDMRIIERIDNLASKIDYKNIYIEIQTNNDKFIIEKNKKNQIGFRTEREIK